MSEKFPNKVTDRKDAIYLAEFILTVLYFSKLIDLKTADKEWKKLDRKWNLKSTHKEGI